MPFEQPHSSRRKVLTAIGAGTVLTVGGAQIPRHGAGSAGQEGDDGEGGADGVGTVHRVRTMISGPPTNPERPADFFYEPTGLHVQPGDVVRFEFVTPDHNVVSYHPAFGMRRRVPLGVEAFSSPLLGFRPSSIPGDQVEPPAESGGEGTPMPGTGTATGTPATETATGTPATETATPETEAPAGEAAPQEGPVPDSWMVAFGQTGVYDLLCSPHETFGMAMRVVVGDVTDTAFETENPEALPEPRVGPVGLARVTLTDPALAPSNVVEQGTVSWQALEATSGEGTEEPEGTETEEGEGTETE